MSEERAGRGVELASLANDEELGDLQSRCRWQMRCLKKGGGPGCRVVDCVSDQVLFVEGREGRTCSHRLSFGEACYCSCELRRRLYLQRRI